MATKKKPTNIKSALRKYENSPADNKRDMVGAKKIAKKEGISVDKAFRKYQNTKEDEVQDKKNAKKMMSKSKKK